MLSHSNDRRPESRPLLRVFQAIDVCYARIYHRLEVISPNPLPREGAAILVCNHTSALDPLLVQSVTRRLIVWMVAKEYYEMPALHWMFRMIEAIPVERGARDMASARSALRALHAGRVLGVFPEGRIETTGELLPFQTGVALMAIRTGVPVFPSYLEGTQRGHASMLTPLIYPQRARIAFAPPIRFEKNETKPDVEWANERIQSAVRALHLWSQCRNKTAKFEKDDKFPVGR